MADFFMETFDPTTHHVNAAAVRQRLEAGKRDDGGRFRITPGSSLLHEKEPEGTRGISLAKLQAEADAERAAKEAARHKKRKAAPEGGAAGDKAAKAKPADAAPDAPPRTWLVPGIVVKLLAKDTSALHKAKGVVREVLPQSRAEVELLEGGARHVMREAQLETVLPKPGGKVLVVGGRYAGVRGVLEGVDVAAFKADVRLADAPHEGLQVQLEYEHVCKTEAQ